MGIRHLETFMKKDVPDGFTVVDMKKEIQDFAKKHNTRPILVIDLISFISLLCEDRKEVLCGGRHKQISLGCDQIFERFIEAGADLVFFEDGAVQDSKEETWCKRQDDKYVKSQKILNDIYEGHSLDQILCRETDNRSQNIPTISTVMTALEVSAAKHGKLYKSNIVECDLEMAAFATKNKVLAVLADDSDFLIFEGDWSYWSIKEISKDLTTKKFDRIALRKHLKLSDREMAILATISGNDIIQYDGVLSFHRSLGKYQKFMNIAQYIKNNITSEDINVNARDIARGVLRDPSEEGINLVKESLSGYDVHYEPTNPYKDDPLMLACLENDCQFEFEVLKGSITNFTLVYFDMSLKDMPMFSNLTLGLFRRQIGVILDHQKADQPCRTVFIKKGHEVPHHSFKLLPIFPPEGLVPDLMDLIFSEDESLLAKRFEILKWIINADEMLENADLTVIPKEYLLDVLVLTFLVHKEMIKVEEADLILFSIKNVNQGLIPDDLKPPPVLNQRAFRVSFLFTKIYNNMRKSFSVVGLREFRKVLDYDGVFFHLQYLKYIVGKQLKDLKVELEDVNEYRLYDLDRN